MDNYKDKEMKCADCGCIFTWTANDQEFYAEKGFEAPKRCRDCAKKRRASFNNNKYGNVQKRRGDRNFLDK